MKKTYYLMAFACFAIASCESGTKENTDTTATDTTTSAASAAAETPAAPMDSAAMMKAWEAYMTPGDMHTLMASWTGKWKGDITMWMDPQAPPTQSTGSAEQKMVLGGRYLQGMHSGNFNGMPFEGQSTMGYDNTKKKFVSTWVDNMGTGVMTMEGTWDDASKTLNMSGECVDPMSGKTMKVREVHTVVDDKTHKMTMFNTPAGGSEFKSMEMTMTKQ